MQPRSSRLGLSLFVIYLTFYGGFVLLNTFSPDTMDHLPWAGINLAVWYGFALIVGAVVLAFIYGIFSRDAED
jgi:uncharacterized membrane protein (DUF485 family)